MSRQLDWEKARRRELGGTPGFSPSTKHRHIIRSKYAADCWECGKHLIPGSMVVFYPERRQGKVRCLDCIRAIKRLNGTAIDQLAEKKGLAAQRLDMERRKAATPTGSATDPEKSTEGGD